MSNWHDAIAELNALIDKHRLGEYRDRLMQHVMHAVALAAARSADQEIPIGSSKLGGEPDLPPDFIWPLRNGQPLSFIAQINLAEIPEIPGRKLPEKGLLSLFYDDRVWGFDPKDKDGFKVSCSSEETSRLNRTKTPVIEIKEKLFGLFPKTSRKPSIYQSCKLVPRPVATLPGEIDDTGLPEEAMDDYYEMLELIGAHHRLLGHSEPIQNSMEIECELVTNGYYCGDSSGYKKASEFEEPAKQWRLLLQIDSETQHSDMMWGDAGRLYIWIKQSDLDAGNFQNCWLISQCY